MRRDYLIYKIGMELMVCLFIVVIVVTGSLGQSIGEVTINYIEALSAPEQSGNRVSAYVTVLDSDQKTVQGLSLSEFKVLEDGNEIFMQGVSQTDEPMSIVLAIDTSGSMQATDSSGKSSMEAAKEAAVEFISMLGSNDKVALFSFNNDTNFHLDFSIDHETSIEAVKDLAARHMAATRLYDTVLDAVKKASEIPKGRRAVIVLTDGKDERGEGTCSIHSFNDVIDAATTKAIRVPIFTMGVGPSVDARELGRMAGLTGGRSMLASYLSELPGFYRSIADQLKNQYLVEYITRSPSGEHSLVIKVTQDEGVGQDEKTFWSPPLPVTRPPEVSIVSPGPDDPIQDIVDVKISVTTPEGISKVRYYIDGTLKEEDTVSPFDIYRWDTAGLPAGLHVLRVEAVHMNGQIGYAETTVKAIYATPAREVMPSAGEVQDETAVSLWICILITLLLIIIAWGLIRRQRKRRKTGISVPGITKVHRGAEPSEEKERPIKKLENSADIDNEATTMDIQSSLEPLAKLTVVKSQELDLGATFKVLGTTEIGRGTGNDIRIPDKPVSRKHAIINYAGGNFHIRDLKSSYGTKVDGQEVTPGGVVINDGAQIQFGTKTVLEFNILLVGKKTDEEDKTMIYNEDS
ncbi:FHA domain-containing protein [Deltaproteobacteria bacterium]|nr:FHA domain-containing protein [Deltaproteobacteria bacterium]